jgi:hypothetical protein
VFFAVMASSLMACHSSMLVADGSVDVLSAPCPAGYPSTNPKPNSVVVTLSPGQRLKVKGEGYGKDFKHYELSLPAGVSGYVIDRRRRGVHVERWVLSGPTRVAAEWGSPKCAPFVGAFAGIDPTGRAWLQIGAAAIGGVTAYVNGGNAAQILQRTLVGAGAGLPSSLGKGWVSSGMMGFAGGLMDNVGSQRIMFKPSNFGSEFVQFLGWDMGSGLATGLAAISN